MLEYNHNSVRVGFVFIGGRKMKRLFVLFLVLVMLLSCAAIWTSCDSGDNGGGNESGNGGNSDNGENGGGAGGEDSSGDVTTSNEYSDAEPSLWDGSVAEGFAGGTGSESDPYLIEDGAQLAYLAETVNDGSSRGYADQYFRLIRNIDLAGKEWDPIGCYHRGPSNLQDNLYAFRGSFDGDGYVISNFKITELKQYYYNYVGLFGYAAENSSIRDLWVKDVTIDVTVTVSRSLFVGGLIGGSAGSISGCHSSGNVSGYNDYYSTSELSYAYVGGLVGSTTDMNASMLDSRSSAAVLSKGATCAYAGGLVAYLNGSITRCYATGSVETICNLKCFTSPGSSVVARAGGLIAATYGSNVTDCYATGKVKTSAECMSSGIVGGLIGLCEGNMEVNGCYASGSVSGEHFGNTTCGGLIGSCSNKVTVSDCHASGDVDGNSDFSGSNSSVAGGLIGTSEGLVVRSYAEGDVSAAGHNYESAAGGLIGEIRYSEAKIENCYATGGVSGDDYAGGLVGEVNGAATVSCCYASGDVLMADKGGALVGVDNSDQGDPARISNCFVTGDVRVSVNGRLGSIIGAESGGTYEMLYYLESQTLSLGGETAERDEYAPGEACTEDQLNGAAFYTDTLGWDSAVWDFSSLDVADGKLPVILHREK